MLESFHVVILICSLLSGGCREHGSYGPFLAPSMNGRVSTMVCFFEASKLLAQDPELSAWVDRLDLRTSKYKIECDSMQVARL
jgi:hypothetical protein